MWGCEGTPQEGQESSRVGAKAGTAALDSQASPISSGFCFAAYLVLYSLPCCFRHGVHILSASGFALS